MSGIDSIIEMINTKTAEKEKEILDEAEKHKEQKMSEAKQKANNKVREVDVWTVLLLFVFHNYSSLDFAVHSF